ncbi:SET domain-containing protein 5 [Eurytemora carolleeae]|uniref:SET domain-containing protein 5 n=1 Tax=Eurytemora carolleeae TaxID=1294199 RepID=UPI000C764728|nr:SET domain-containing protein 5 [Eurytemora carolleeae]|eukprot:XP_023320423.1 SET domain-containing protein 5-like [Eurytemora affinis]
MEENEIFKSVPIQGKGHGVVALRDIQVGELILAEFPLIQVPWWIRHSQYAQREKKQFLEHAVRTMSKKDRLGFFSLHDSKVPEGAEKTISGIWRTNNFALGASGPRADNGLFLLMSRFNHSCEPSAEFHWNKNSRKQEIRATRRISKGLEITISYFTIQIGILSQKERKEYLSAQYGFPCDCHACTLQGSDLLKNDYERSEVGLLEGRIETLLYDYESEEENFKSSHLSDSDNPEECIKEAINLSFIRLELMSRLSFKVVSQLRVCKLILDTALEWDLFETAVQAADRGCYLSTVLYGQSSDQCKVWKEKLKELKANRKI